MDHRRLERGVPRAGADRDVHLAAARLVSRRPCVRSALFRPGLSGKARDFNWHNVIGIWSAPVLVVLTFTAMCISFPKTYDVIYAVTGMSVRQRRRAHRHRPAARGQRRRRSSRGRPMATIGAPGRPR